MAQMIFFLNIFFVLYPSFCASKFLAGISPLHAWNIGEHSHTEFQVWHIDGITSVTKLFLFMSFSLSLFYI